MTSFRDWVVETSSTTGTGAYDLSGSAPAGTGYFIFRDRYSNGEDEVSYWAVSADRTKWEKNRFCTLTYGTPDTLTRNVVESTNGDAPVSWVGGDGPLRLYVVPDADAEEFAISMGLGITRPGVLKFGIWADRDDVSSGIHTLKLFDGTNDIPIGRVDTVQGKFMPFGFETGMCVPYMGATAPAGWILHTTLSIGSAASAAARANADTLDLFTKLWTDYSNTEAPVSGGRGASAAADFAANKVLTMPNLQGRVPAGRETTATRLTTAGSGIDGDTLGASGGEETHQLLTTEAAGQLVSATATGPQVGTLDFAGGASPVYFTTAGPHNNTQPTIVMNYLIKL